MDALVVYFDQLLGAVRTQKLLKLFSTFFDHLKLFSVISRQNQQKNVWKWTKIVTFVYSSKLVDMKKLVDSLRGGTSNLSIFGWFFVKTAGKKFFDQLSGAHSTWKLVEIHNVQFLLFSMQCCCSLPLFDFLACIKCDRK